MSDARPAVVSSFGSGSRRSRYWLLLPLLSLTALGATASENSTATAGQPATNSTTAHRDRDFLYRNEQVADIPWSIHVVRIDRSSPDFEFRTTLGGPNHTLGMKVVSDQVKSLSVENSRPIAAVNGDFYKNSTSNPGDPMGLQICDGELLSSPIDRPVFWMDPNGNPRMDKVTSGFRISSTDGVSSPFVLNEERANESVVLYTPAMGASTHTKGGTEFVLEKVDAAKWLPLRVGQTLSARVKEVRTDGDTAIGKEQLVLSLGSKVSGKIAKLPVGAIVEISTATTPDLAGVTTALGGYPTLIRDGKLSTWSGNQPRHPRTALGWNKTHLFLVEVDGRQRNLSVGMTFPELATYFQKLGCDNAMGLDGGGSATMWVYGNVVNSPSEGHERPAANALVVMKKDRHTP